MVAYKQALGRGGRARALGFLYPLPLSFSLATWKIIYFVTENVDRVVFLAAPARKVLKQFVINERGPYSTFQLRAWLSPPSRSAKWRMLCRVDTVDLSPARQDFTLPHYYLELTNKRLT